MIELSDLRARVESNPENILFRFSLAQQLCKEDLYEEAIKHLQVCTQQKPDWMMAHILLGKALLRAQRLSQAKVALEKSLQLAIKQHHEEPQEEIQTLLGEAST